MGMMMDVFHCFGSTPVLYEELSMSRRCMRFCGDSCWSMRYVMLSGPGEVLVLVVVVRIAWLSSWMEMFSLMLIKSFTLSGGGMCRF